MSSDVKHSSLPSISSSSSSSSSTTPTAAAIVSPNRNCDDGIGRAATDSSEQHDDSKKKNKKKDDGKTIINIDNNSNDDDDERMINQCINRIGTHRHAPNISTSAAYDPASIKFSSLQAHSLDTHRCCAVSSVLWLVHDIKEST
jgi:hypothetical protein